MREGHVRHHMAFRKDGRMLQPLDIKHSMMSLPREPRFVFPGLRPGRLGLLSAPGGTGKSFLMLELALSVVIGKPLLDGIVPDFDGGRVTYITMEEDHEDLHRRLWSVCQEFPEIGIAEAEDTVSENLTILPLLGHRIEVCTSDGINQKGYDFLAEVSDGASLVILDPLSKLHRCDENSAVEMNYVVDVLTRLAHETGAAFLISHHTSKAAVLNGYGDMSQSARGSSAIIDAVRFAMSLNKPSEKEAQKRGIEEERSWYVDLTWTKLNNHAPKEPLRLKRTSTGVLVPAPTVVRQVMPV